MGILAFLPIAFFIVYIITILSFFSKAVENPQMMQEQNPEEIFSFIKYIIPVLLLLSIAGILSLIFYIIDVVQNPKFTNDSANNKVVWILLIILLGFISIPIYFFLEIYKRPIKN